MTDNLSSSQIKKITSVLSIFFISILLLVFNINIGGIEILPHFICYFLIFWGTRKLFSAQNLPAFNKAIKITLTLSVVSLLNLIFDIFNLGIVYSFFYSVLMTVSHSFLFVFMIYFIISGICEIFRSVPIFENYSSVLEKKFQIFLLLEMIFLPITIAVMFFSEELEIVLIVSPFLMIAEKIWLAFIFRKMKKIFLESLDIPVIEPLEFDTNDDDLNNKDSAEIKYLNDEQNEK